MVEGLRKVIGELVIIGAEVIRPALPAHLEHEGAAVEIVVIGNPIRGFEAKPRLLPVDAARLGAPGTAEEANGVAIVPAKRRHLEELGGRLCDEVGVAPRRRVVEQHPRAVDLAAVVPARRGVPGDDPDEPSGHVGVQRPRRLAHARYGGIPQDVGPGAVIEHSARGFRVAKVEGLLGRAVHVDSEQRGLIETRNVREPAVVAVDSTQRRGQRLCVLGDVLPVHWALVPPAVGREGPKRTLNSDRRLCKHRADIRRELRLVEKGQAAHRQPPVRYNAPVEPAYEWVPHTQSDGNRCGHQSVEGEWWGTRARCDGGGPLHPRTCSWSRTPCRRTVQVPH
eukprot:m.69479 g.69479  ORF g.69479 m.69479 type:complete len:338 (-) comp18393_c0_seq2:680-1693(-)